MNLVAQAIVGAALLLAGVALAIYGLAFGSYAPAFRVGVVGWLLAAGGLLICVHVFRECTRRSRFASAKTLAE